MRYIREHPRRCYTLLFRGYLTWLLFFILFIFNMIEVGAILYFDRGNQAISSDYDKSKLSMSKLFVAARFQAVMTRHTGGSIFA